MTKYCIDADGNYLGGFPEVPPGATEVSDAPEHAAQKRVGNGWGPVPDLRSVDQKRMAEYPSVADQMDALFTYLEKQNPAIASDPDIGPVITSIRQTNARHPKL